MFIFPLLLTNRLKLRKLDVDDIPLLVEYADNKKISNYIINIPHPYQESHAVFRLSYVVKGFNERSRFVFAIAKNDNNKFIGEISLHMEQNNQVAQLGYWIGETYWNLGFATEAIQAIVSFGFDKFDIKEIYATCHEENIASIKVLIKNHFQMINVNGKIALLKLMKDKIEQALP